MNEKIEGINMNLVEEKTSLINNVRLKVYQIIKDVFDILFSFFGIVVMVIVAIILKISYMLTGDFNSIFFSQKRVGRNGKEFKMYKFRTMVPDAEERLKELIKKEPYKTQWKENQKLDNDPRITKIGNILRKTSLDELPQFINVVCCQLNCGY